MATFTRAEKWPQNCQGRQFQSKSSGCAENRPYNFQGRQFQNTVLKTGHRTSKVGSSRTSSGSRIGQSAEKRPQNCQGRQFCDEMCESAENWPQNCQGRQFYNVAIELPRSAVLWPLFPTSVYGRFAQVFTGCLLLINNSYMQQIIFLIFFK